MPGYCGRLSVLRQPCRRPWLLHGSYGCKYLSIVPAGILMRMDSTHGPFQGRCRWHRPWAIFHLMSVAAMHSWLNCGDR
jgi:hypothetical protein